MKDKHPPIASRMKAAFKAPLKTRQVSSSIKKI
jgi:hypothetical protein